MTWRIVVHAAVAGTPWATQAALDVLERGGNAFDAAVSAPESFAPHVARPGTLRLEADLFATLAASLRELGYTVIEDPKWDKDFGAVGAILVGEDGRLYAGADPRKEIWAGGR